MKKRLRKIIIGAIIFFIAVLIEKIQFTSSNKHIVSNIQMVLYVCSYLIVGFDVLKKAVTNIFHGEFFDENFLMSIATIGAFAIREFPEAVAVMLFYQVGEYFQSYAVKKSRKSIASLMDIRPDYANLKVNGNIEKKSPEEVKIGDTIVVKPGEKVPLDGVIIEGNSMLDTAALTGESVPREVRINDNILSGCINLNGVLEVKVEKEFGESTVSKILDLVENATNRKAKTENFITRFSKYYTPIVVILALIIAFVLPIVTDIGMMVWLYRALTFLVVSCPCALVISVPLSFFSGIGAASKKGILVKGSNYLELLSKTQIAVFDKTGTLTEGVFEVQKIVNEKNIEKNELLELATYCESYSNHPISISIQKAYGKEIDKKRIIDSKEVAGKGIISKIDDKEVACGNIKLMETLSLKDIKQVNEMGTVIYVAIDKQYAGYILISDKIKEDSKKAIQDLKKAGIKKTVMLTGDNKDVAEKVNKELNLDVVYSELLPVDKVNKVEELLKNKDEEAKLVFIGDGINDAPVLARADIGIAMGALGSDAAIEAADIVIMTDEPSKIATAIKISRKTLKIVYQNISFALIVKIGVLILSALGLASMWAAVFADVGVTVLAVLNSFRALKSN